MRAEARTTVEKDTWEEVGGPGTAVAVDDWGVMVVSQTEEIHEKIANLLTSIRQVRTGQGEHKHSAHPGPPAPDQNQPTSIKADSVRSRSAHTKIFAALDAVTKAEFLETPLADVLSFLQEVHKIPIYLDKNALEESGLGPDTPVTIALKSVSLRSLLRLMLRELELTYVVQDEVLKITTREAAEAQLVTRVYPVRDLAVIPEARAAATRMSAPKRRVNPPAKSDSTDPFGAPQRRKANPAVKSDSTDPFGGSGQRRKANPPAKSNSADPFGG